MIQSSRKRPAMYGLSTCGWCAKAREWLERNVGDFDLVYVDLLDRAERDRVVTELRQHVHGVAFPLVFFGNDWVMGFKPDEYERLLER
jgi:glutaredoxin-like protein NrdH